MGTKTQAVNPTVTSAARPAQDSPVCPCLLPSGWRGTAPSCSAGLGGRAGLGAQQRKPQVGQGGVGGPVWVRWCRLRLPRLLQAKGQWGQR